MPETGQHWPLRDVLSGKSEAAYKLGVGVSAHSGWYIQGQQLPSKAPVLLW